ncbi:unnamed protein product [Diamesa serratosioi]
MSYDIILYRNHITKQILEFEHFSNVPSDTCGKHFYMNMKSPLTKAEYKNVADKYEEIVKTMFEKSLWLPTTGLYLIEIINSDHENVAGVVSVDSFNHDNDTAALNAATQNVGNLVGAPDTKNVPAVVANPDDGNNKLEIDDSFDSSATISVFMQDNSRYGDADINEDSRTDDFESFEEDAVHWIEDSIVGYAKFQIELDDALDTSTTKVENSSSSWRKYSVEDSQDLFMCENSDHDHVSVVANQDEDMKSDDLDESVDTSVTLSNIYDPEEVMSPAMELGNEDSIENIFCPKVIRASKSEQQLACDDTKDTEDADFKYELLESIDTSATITNESSSCCKEDSGKFETIWGVALGSSGVPLTRVLPRLLKRKLSFSSDEESDQERQLIQKMKPNYNSYGDTSETEGVSTPDKTDEESNDDDDVANFKRNWGVALGSVASKSELSKTVAMKKEMRLRL